MGTLDRITEPDFQEALSSLRRGASEVESPLLASKLNEACDRLEPIVHDLSKRYPWPGKSDEAATWLRKLDGVQGALAACTTAQGVGSMCRPFFDKVDKLIADCQQWRAAPGARDQAAPAHP